MTALEAYLSVPYLDFGRSFDGADCWGLVCLIYAQEKGINLERYEGLSSDELEARATGAGHPDWKRVDDRQDYDLVILKSGRPGGYVPNHCGLYFNGRVLHTRRDHGPSLLRLTKPGVAMFIGDTYRHVRLY